MKRLIFLLLALVAAPLLAQDRDMLLTSEGTLYTIESTSPIGREGLDTNSETVLSLMVQNGEETSELFVPASLNGGRHSAPALAYDTASRSLFVFWQKQPNRMSSELLFCALKDGRWSAPTSIDNRPFRLRFNLRLGVTRLVQEPSDDKLVPKPGLTIHTIWWEQTGYGESARYAMLSLADGTVRSIVIRDLPEFVNGTSSDRKPFPLEEGFQYDFFRHPVVFETAGQDAVRIIFADWHTHRLHTLNLKPSRRVTPDGVLHVPIGVWEGEVNPPGRFMRTTTTDSRISILPGRTSKRMVLYYREEQALKYHLHAAGKWADPKTLGISEKLSSEAGIEVLRKLAESE